MKQNNNISPPPRHLHDGVTTEKENRVMLLHYHVDFPVRILPNTSLRNISSQKLRLLSGRQSIIHTWGGWVALFLSSNLREMRVLQGIREKVHCHLQCSDRAPQHNARIFPESKRPWWRNMSSRAHTEFSVR
ncbi:unnamed protein product [Allacma fusca]|uniref:Uncharacterized protein n=1 Tax=Allacma fusca TaxID=39272 RepID=A0A8J2LL67_9HEXA|nr:unnamed protein product [Allacma fusca]